MGQNDQRKLTKKNLLAIVYKCTGMGVVVVGGHVGGVSLRGGPTGNPRAAGFSVQRRPVPRARA